MLTQQITDGTVMCHTGHSFGYGYNNNNNNNYDCLIDGQRNIGSLITDGQSRLTTNINTVSRDVLNTQHDLSKEIGDNKFYTATGFSDLRQEVAQNRFQLSEVNNDINKEIGNSRVQTAQYFNEMNKEIFSVKESVSEKYASLLLEQHKSASLIREDNLRNFAATQLDACKNTNEILRQAADNYAKLSRENAECCCEIKTSLLTQAASIRELDLKIEINRLKDRCDNNDRHSRGNDIEIAIHNVLGNISKKS